MDDRGAIGSGRLLVTDFQGAADICHPMAFNATGTRLAITREGGADHVLVFDPRSGREVARLAHLPCVEWLGFLSAEVLLVVVGGKWFDRGTGKCLRCDLRSGERTTLWPEDEEYVRSAAVSPNGRIAALGKGDSLVLYDVVKRQVRHRLTTLSDYHGPIFPTFSAGGRYVAAYLSVDNCGPHLIAVWDAQEGRRQRTFEVGQGARPLAFREDTLTLAVADSDLRIYEPDRGEDPAAAHALGGRVRALRFRNRGRTLAVLLDDGGISFLQAKTGQIERMVPPPAGPTLIYATPNADWSLFAGAAEGGVFVWHRRSSRTH